MKDSFASFVNKIAKKTAAKVEKQKTEKELRLKNELSALSVEAKVKLKELYPAYIGKELDYEKAIILADAHNLLVDTVRAVYLGK